MSDVYRNANKILVLESSLLEASLRSIRLSRLPEGPRKNNEVSAVALEAAMRVHASKWMRRLWTLQEAALGLTQVYFQFHDGSIGWTDLLLRYQPTPQSRLPIYSQLAQSYYDMRGWLGKGEVSKFIEFCSALKWRATSKAEDETICLSTLMNFDPARMSRILEKRTREERMQEFLSCFAQLPRDLLFGPVERLQVDGYRWAPASLMNTNAKLAVSVGSNPDNIADMTHKGLKFHGLGFVFIESSLVVVEPYIFFFDNTTKQLFVIVQPEGQGPLVEWRDIGLSRKKLAVLPAMEPREEGAWIVPAALVSICSVEINHEYERFECIYVRYECHVILSPGSSEMQRGAERNPRANQAYFVETSWCVE